MMPGKLFITATPIGNYEDITLRAIKVLNSVDFIVCEDLKEARRLLSKLDLKKELVTLNEHDEAENTPEIMERLANGESAALISDCGTPMIADPGHHLLDNALAFGIDIIPVPGVSSLTTALSISALHAEKFYYYGWLPVKKEMRLKELKRLTKLYELLIFLETPYRLKNIAREVVDNFGRGAETVLAFDLTQPSEKIIRGSAGRLLEVVTKNNLKGEFVLLVDNRKK
ncbi:16S rRNA (cytidine(1402)-2'-O)-methyltransferase [Ignavibacteriales bacterium]